MTMHAGVRWVAVWVGAGVLLGAGVTTQPIATQPATSRPAESPAGEESGGGEALADVQAAHDAKKYPEACVGARKLIAAVTGGLSVEDRHAAYILGAMSHLQLKQQAQATALLAAGQKESEEKDQEKDAAEAQAFAFLIQNSSRNLYTVKGDSGAEKLDILDADQRKKAYTALFQEQIHHFNELKEAAQGQTSLKPLLEIAKAFSTARALELTGTAGTTECDALASGLEQWAQKVISASLDGFDGRVTRIQINSNVNAQGRLHPDQNAGINDADRAELHQIIADCEKVPETIQTFTAAFHRPWQMPRALNRAKNIGQRAEKTLEKNKAVGNGKGCGGAGGGRGHWPPARGGDRIFEVAGERPPR